jgi:hypothetical protein
MTPGPTLIKECPHCGQLFCEATLNSGNTFGATYWTDGKREAPMLPESPSLVKCGSCDKFIWIDEAEEVGQVEPFESTSQFDTLDFVELDEQGYLDALDQEITSDPEKTHYLRMKAWWAANDQHRQDTDHAGEPVRSEGARRNMDRLCESLSDSDEEQRLMKAELTRELGNFEEAGRLLASLTRPELQHAVQRITQLNQERTTRVATLF